MDVGVITLLPEMFAAITDHGVSGRGFQGGLMRLHLWNPRDFTRDRHRTVDDKPFGGGPGMLMKTEPLAAAIDAARQRLPGARVVFLSPQGQPLKQGRLQAMADDSELILLCGRYQGIDQRVIDQQVDEELSLGDYVLSGGELAAMVLLDGLMRLQPGALGDDESASSDSFSAQGLGLLHCPQYTRPARFDEQGKQQVPEVLLSGDHQRIARWRMKQSLGVTWRKRPDLLTGCELSSEQQALLEEYKQEFKAGRS